MIDDKIIDPLAPPPSYSPQPPPADVGYPQHGGFPNGGSSQPTPHDTQTMHPHMTAMPTTPSPVASPSTVPASYPSSPDARQPFLSPQPYSAFPNPQQTYIAPGQASPEARQVPQQQQQPMSADMSLALQYQHQLLARCARGDHDIHRKYGILGIVGAVVLFPCGLICLFIDSEEKCARCGVPV
ncbi:hypothetical protein B0H21DRAFT_69023 [Amylocystis lapponica]|nr:hypothetical protein B0H21DRAFT_69023 [Amylocystis lapponica]